MLGGGLGGAAGCSTRWAPPSTSSSWAAQTAGSAGRRTRRRCWLLDALGSVEHKPQLYSTNRQLWADDSEARAGCSTLWLAEHKQQLDSTNSRKCWAEDSEALLAARHAGLHRAQAAVGQHKQQEVLGGGLAGAAGCSTRWAPSSTSRSCIARTDSYGRMTRRRGLAARRSGLPSTSSSWTAQTAGNAGRRTRRRCWLLDTLGSTEHKQQLGSTNSRKCWAEDSQALLAARRAGLRRAQAAAV